MHLSGRHKWKRKPTARSVLSLSLLTLLLFFFFFVFSNLFSDSGHQFPAETVDTGENLRRCGSGATGERFLWYAPHSGFSNQVAEFKNAVLMAAILNRTVIVPPILDHHAVALGSCPKFRVLSPKELRFRVWEHVVELIRTGRYVSMTDIIDLSVLPSSMIRTIDLRDFISSWCGIDMDSACSDDSSLLNKLKQCGSLLSGLHSNFDKCFYAVNVDCRTIVWTYNQNDSDGTLDSFQPDQKLKEKKKLSYVRRRQDVYKTFGPGSEAHLSTVIAFGSLFTAPYKGTELYIDIHESRGDPNVQSLIEKIEFIPVVSKIIDAGKDFAHKVIGSPFLCAQLRLLDGQFKNHWNATFSELRQKVESLKQKSSTAVHIFVMTDLPEANWKGSYLGDLSQDLGLVKLHVLRKDDRYVAKTAREVAELDRRLRSSQVSRTGHRCPNQLPDVLLYVEEVVCSCAALGFVGTAGSTIAESIELMRKNGLCSGLHLVAS